MWLTHSARAQALQLVQPPERRRQLAHPRVAVSLVEHVVRVSVRPLEVERPPEASAAGGASLAHALAVDEEPRGVPTHSADQACVIDG